MANKKKGRQRRAAAKRRSQERNNESTSGENHNVKSEENFAEDSNKNAKKCMENSFDKNGVTSPVGLTNLGNTCFFNSIMQNLIQTPLLHSMLKHEIKFAQAQQPTQVCPDDDETPPLTYTPGPLGQLSFALSSFFDAAKSQENPAIQSNGTGKQRAPKSRVLSPKKLFNNICLKNARFRGYQQQDSQELFHCLLDAVKTEEIKRRKKGILQAMNLDKAKPKEVPEEVRMKVKAYGRQVSEKEDTIIEKVFGGKLISSILCDGCGTVTGVTEPFHDISLPIVEDKHPVLKRDKTATNQKEENQNGLPDENAVNKTTSTPMSKHALKKAKREARRQNRQNCMKQTPKEQSISSNPEEVLANQMETLADAMVESALCNAFQILTISNEAAGRITNDACNIPETYKKIKGGAVNIESLNLPKDEGSGDEKKEDGDDDDDDDDDDSDEKLIPDFMMTEENSCDGSPISARVSSPSDRDTCLTSDKDSSDEKSFSKIEASLFDTPTRRFSSNTYSEFACNLPETLVPRHHPQSKDCSLESCFYQFTMPEMLSGSNMFGCETCTKRKSEDSEGEKKTVYSTASKQMLVKKPPAILTIHLKRFQQNGYSLRKVNKHVSIPTYLDIAPFCSVLCKEYADEEMRIAYNLYGMVEHSGSLSRGHYTAYIKVCSENGSGEPPHPGVWYHVSDCSVSRTTETRALNCNAYLLFYERIK